MAEKSLPRKAVLVCDIKRTDPAFKEWYQRFSLVSVNFHADKELFDKIIVDFYKERKRATGSELARLTPNVLLERINASTPNPNPTPIATPSTPIPPSPEPDTPSEEEQEVYENFYAGDPRDDFC